MAIGKIKSWGSFLSYKLDSTANPAHLPKKWAKWAELAVLISWQLQNGPQDFDFFQLSLVPIIHLSLFSLRPMLPNLLYIIKIFLVSVHCFDI